MANKAPFGDTLRAGVLRDVYPTPGKVRWGRDGGSRRVFTCACGKVQAGGFPASSFFRLPSRVSAFHFRLTRTVNP